MNFLTAANTVSFALANSAKDVWFDNPAICEAFWPSVWETLVMTGWST